MWDLHYVLFFFFGTTLIPTHTYAYIALWLTFKLPTLVYHCHAYEENSLKHCWGAVRGRSVFYFGVIRFLPCCVKLPPPRQWCALSRRKVPWVEGDDKGSRERRWGCQSRKEVLGKESRAASNGSGETPRIQISSIIGWQWSWRVCMSLCKCAGLNHTCTHTHAHTQHSNMWEGKMTDTYAHIWSMKVEKRPQWHPPVLPPPWRSCQCVF